MRNAVDDLPFLRAILAAYPDDGPRLLYADYLEDSPDLSDQDRAEFIRLQLALAKLPEHHPRRKELIVRQNNLLVRHHGDWTAHLHGLAAGFHFRRGLLDAVAIDGGAFLSKGEELFERAAIRRVRFNDAGRTIAKLAACPLLGRIRELDLCGNDLGNGGLNILLRSPHLQRVESLDLSFNGLDDTGVQLLAETTALPRLRALWLNGNSVISANGIVALAGAPAFAELRSLDLSGNDIDGTGIIALIASDHLKQLHTLNLHGNPLGDRGLAALAPSDLLGRMLAHEPRLDLRQNDIGPAGIKALVQSPQVLPLVSLDLSGNSLGDAGLHAIAMSSLLSKLRRLSVPQNRIGDLGAISLAQSALMGRLAYLDIASNGLTHDSIDVLLAKRKDLEAVVDYAGNITGASS